MKGLLFFVSGVSVGYAAAILTAPKPGHRLRAQLRSKAEEGIDYMKKSSSNLRDQAAGMARKGSQLLTNQADAMAEGWQAGRTAYSRRVNA
jgi:gas vesicle protein